MPNELVDRLRRLADILRPKGLRQDFVNWTVVAEYYETAAARIAELEVRLEAVTEAARVARGQFAFYVEQHRLKTPPDEAKAATNQRHVDLLDAVLSAITDLIIQRKDAPLDKQQASATLSEVKPDD